MSLRFILLATLSVYSLHAKPLELEVSAKSAILMNADTGAVLFEKHSTLPIFPASTTKMATVLYALEGKKVDLSQMVTVSGESLRMKPPKTDWSNLPPHWLEIDGTSLGLRKGEQVTIETLLHGMMLVSGNDASNVLAETVSGSVPTFMDELNLYLKSIGCQKTHFRNPHGLHDSQHMTTAYDMALIAKRALQIGIFRDIVRKITYMKPKSNKQAEVELRQFNQFIRNGKYHYSKAIGIKTGYMSHAQHTLVSAAEQDGRTLIAAVFGCKSREEYIDAKKMFEAAFAEQKQRRVVFSGRESYQRIVEGAKTPLVAELAQEMVIEYYPAEEPDLKAYIHWAVPTLPIPKGRLVGEMRLIDANGTIFQATPLVSREEVKGTFLSTLKEKWGRLIR